MEASVNKIMETIMMGKNYPSIKDPVGNVTYKDGLIELSDQFSGLVSPMSD